MKEEFERIQRMTVLEQQAHFLYQDIVNNILNLSCPRCKIAFVDFDGCFALTCKCGAAFCAYCLKDCGSDAHAHVHGCGSIYGTMEIFNAHQNRRRRGLLEAKLREEPKELKNLIRQSLSRDLRDLGIDFEF